MYQKSMIVSSLIACTTLMISCNATPKETSKATPEKTLVGNDRDSHGCISSAGYQWSELLKDCIRPWDKGIKLATPIDSTSTSAAYLVFSADSSQVEVYLPQTKQRPILHREEGTNRTCWSNAPQTDITVEHDLDTWTIFQNDEPLFMQ